jgi:hypothetical protein
MAVALRWTGRCARLSSLRGLGRRRRLGPRSGVARQRPAGGDAGPPLPRGGGARDPNAQGPPEQGQRGEGPPGPAARLRTPAPWRTRAADGEGAPFLGEGWGDVEEPVAGYAAEVTCLPPTVLSEMRGVPTEALTVRGRHLKGGQRLLQGAGRQELLRAGLGGLRGRLAAPMLRLHCSRSR